MRYDAIDPSLFQQNRKRFMRKMQPDSIAIFQSNDLMPRSGDTFFPFRQNSGLFYLSGLGQEETVLVLFPDCIKEGFQELAFIKRTDEHIAIWEGQKYTKEEASKISGIEKIYWLDEMDKILHELILLAKRIYLNLNEHDRFQSEVLTRDVRFAKQLMDRYPLHKYHRAQPILKKLAMVKSQMEVELIQRSVGITGKAFQRVLKTTRPGMMEYEIEAEIIHEFIRNGANGHAYEPIVGSGPNATVLHYHKNDRQMEDGDLLLIDAGSEYGYYASDVTRTFPVNGKFSEPQREIYEIVLAAQLASIERTRPGATLEEVHDASVRVIAEGLLRLDILSGTLDEILEKQSYKPYYMHRTSHWLGMDVHDVGMYFIEGKARPLAPGMVITVEPGIYINAAATEVPERYRGIGVRIEDDVLVTAEGPSVLSEAIPKTVDDVERACSA